MATGLLWCGIVIGSALMFGACDPLVEDGFRGEVLFSMEGQVYDYSLTTGWYDDPRATLFWTATEETTTNPDLFQDDIAVAVEVSFPTTVRVNVFEPPKNPTSGTLPYAIGELLVWQDTDANGRYSEDEFRGGALDNIVLFASTPVSAEASPTGRVLPAGFSLAQLPLDCEMEPQTPMNNLSESNCGVSLGDACQDDSDCGPTGECLVQDRNTIFPGGYCVVPYGASCIPENAALFELNDQSLIWGQGCFRHRDCERSGYSCSLSAGVCFPDGPVEVFIDSRSRFTELCEPKSTIAW